MRKKFSTSAVAVAVAAAGALGGGLLTAAPAAAAAPQPAAATAQDSEAQSAVGAQSTRSRADAIMKQKYSTFIATKKKRAKPFVWSSDGCSGPAKLVKYGKIFDKACQQHDFGYRNYGKGTYSKLKLSPSTTTKTWIDNRFKAEMNRTCTATYKKGSKALTSCRNAAKVFHSGVALGGNKSFFG